MFRFISVFYAVCLIWHCCYCCGCRCQLNLNRQTKSFCRFEAKMQPNDSNQPNKNQRNRNTHLNLMRIAYLKWRTPFDYTKNKGETKLRFNGNEMNVNIYMINKNIALFSIISFCTRNVYHIKLMAHGMVNELAHKSMGCFAQQPLAVSQTWQLTLGYIICQQMTIVMRRQKIFVTRLPNCFNFQIKMHKLHSLFMPLRWWSIKCLICAPRGIKMSSIMLFFVVVWIFPWAISVH